MRHIINACVIVVLLLIVAAIIGVPCLGEFQRRNGKRCHDNMRAIEAAIAAEFLTNSIVITNINQLAPKYFISIPRCPYGSSDRASYLVSYDGTSVWIRCPLDKPDNMFYQHYYQDVSLTMSVE